MCQLEYSTVRADRAAAERPRAAFRPPSVTHRAGPAPGGNRGITSGTILEEELRFRSIRFVLHPWAAKYSHWMWHFGDR
jgi:hypothetical protein